jgi:hypothetical protein
VINPPQPFLFHTKKNNIQTKIKLIKDFKKYMFQKNKGKEREYQGRKGWEKKFFPINGLKK